MQFDKAGFIGLGVMGEPICRNMAAKSGIRFVAYDLAREPLERLAAHGVEAAADVAAIARGCDIVFLSLPGGPQVEAVALGADGLLVHGRPGQVVVDMSTTPVGLTREIAGRLAEKGLRLADAPVARTRQAAEDGTLSVTVGADADLFAAIVPLIGCAASDVTHCGPVGCGQVVKILNNMVLFQNVVALAEALIIGEAAGVERKLLFSALSKGSADSFALRNHGMQAMLPDTFPKAAFPTDYAIKDAGYALQLAEQVGFEAEGARLARSILQRASEAGFGADYFPVLVRYLKDR